MKLCRTILFFGALLVGVSCFTGCATPKREAAAYRGPLQEPKEDAFWWEVAGFFLVPIGTLFSDATAR